MWNYRVIDDKVEVPENNTVFSVVGGYRHPTSPSRSGVCTNASHPAVELGVSVMI